MTLWNIYALTRFTKGLAFIMIFTTKKILNKSLNFWNISVSLSLQIYMMVLLALKQKIPRILIINEMCFVGATSDCKDFNEYASLENENTSTVNRGILTTEHENYAGMLEVLVIYGYVVVSILSQSSISINPLLECYV